MSINIATGGMYNSCCGTRFSGGGGAPPYRAYAEEHVTPIVLVKNVSVKTIKSRNTIFKNIKVKLLGDGGN